MKSVADITNLSEYVQAFSDDLARKVADQCEPIYDPAKMPLHPRLADIKTKPFPAQAAKITAQVLALKETGLSIDASKMGTGKTMAAISTIHCLFDGKPYRVLVMCPPHLTKKWVAEVHKFLGGAVQASVVDNWQDFIAIPRTRPAVPTWYIISETTAKLGYSCRAATITRRKKKASAMGEAWVDCECCPRCDRSTGMSKDTIQRLRSKCIAKWCKPCGKPCHPDIKECPDCGVKMRECGEPLYQPNQHKVSPCQFVKATGVRLFDVFVRDEAHKSKSASSIDGYAMAVFAQYAKYVCILTGTLLAGKSEDLRPMLFRLRPKPFIDLGFGWKSELPFAEKYGRIQTVVRKSSGGGDSEKKKHGKGDSKSTSRDVKPGIMPHLFPHYVANYTTFMSIHDLATDLPSYEEETISVAMEPMMKAFYDEMKVKMLDRFRELYVRDRKAAASMLGPMLETLMTWPDVPYGRKPVYADNSLVLIPPAMDHTLVFPKEARMLDIVNQEKIKRRKVWVYSDRDDTRERLVQIMESHGIKVAHLQACVKPATRIDWLEKHAPSCDVGICNPSLVETGMELFGPGFNFPTLLWYSTGWRLNTLRQASMRSYRIGQTLPCRTLYLYYAESAQEKAIGIMASKLVASEALEGKFSDGGLADEATDEDLAIEVARTLSENIKVNIVKKYNPVAGACTRNDRLALLRKKLAENMTGRT